MRLFTTLLAPSLLALGLLACSPYPGPNQSTINKEDRLEAAGFKRLPLKSEAQLSEVRGMPTHLIRPASYRGKIIYVYSDPTICNCIYVGGKTAYNTYINAAQGRFVNAEYTESTTDNGYSPSPWMLDGGPWDDADMYGLYLN
jgi:hypothetical protein